MSSFRGVQMTKQKTNVIPFETAKEACQTFIDELDKNKFKSKVALTERMGEFNKCNNGQKIVADAYKDKTQQLEIEALKRKVKEFYEKSLSTFKLERKDKSNNIETKTIEVSTVDVKKVEDTNKNEIEIFEEEFEKEIEIVKEKIENEIKIVEETNEKNKDSLLNESTYKKARDTFIYAVQSRYGELNTNNENKKGTKTGAIEGFLTTLEAILDDRKKTSEEKTEAVSKFYEACNDRLGYGFGRQMSNVFTAFAVFLVLALIVASIGALVGGLIGGAVVPTLVGAAIGVAAGLIPAATVGVRTGLLLFKPNKEMSAVDNYLLQAETKFQMK
jgi:hypothetical protein